MVAVGAVAPHIGLFFLVNDVKVQVILGIDNIVIAVQVVPALQGQPVAVLKGANDDNTGVVGKEGVIDNTLRFED